MLLKRTETESKLMERLKKSLDIGDIDAAANDHRGHILLDQAARCGCTKLVQLLLDNGLYLASGGCGQTALYYAAKWGHYDTVQFLLKNGLDSEARDGFGRTALQGVARVGHRRTVQLLLEKGSDIQARNEHGWTALHFAACYEHEKRLCSCC